MKHTRGPWSIELRGERFMIVGCATYFGIDSTEPICKTYRLCDGEAANARLIAAAPDLLEACKDVRDFLKHSGYDTRIVDAAIEKASHA